MLREALKRFVDLERAVLVLKVDLSDPKNRRPDPGLSLAPFDKTALPWILRMVEVQEPWRAKAVRQRFLEGMSGFVVEAGGEPIGYVFWVEGTDQPHRVVHSDLVWLGPRPARGEIYMFDYFLIERARGLGARFVRTVQDAHHRMGYRTAYGCVFAENRAALWLYRTTGWIEIARVTEHRVLSRIALVGRTIYWMRPFSRVPILSV